MAELDLVITADIARRLGLSHERVRQLGQEPGFPRPIGKLGRSLVWRWRDIEKWAKRAGRLPD